jgi:hypothetical protein
VALEVTGSAWEIVRILVSPARRPCAAATATPAYHARDQPKIQPDDRCQDGRAASPLSPDRPQILAAALVTGRAGAEVPDRRGLGNDAIRWFVNGAVLIAVVLRLVPKLG